jgi:hypothetical protein
LFALDGGNLGAFAFTPFCCRLWNWVNYTGIIDERGFVSKLSFPNCLHACKANAVATQQRPISHANKITIFTSSRRGKQNTASRFHKLIMNLIVRGEMGSTATVVMAS